MNSRIMSLSQSSKNELLMYTVSKGSEEELKDILKYTSPNIFAPNTPLAMAANDGNYNKVEILLLAGADPNLIKGRYGSIALCNAVFNCDIKIMKLLFSHGANPDLGGYESPLTIVSEKSCFEAVQLLVENGADVKQSRIGGEALAAAMKKLHSNESTSSMKVQYAIIIEYLFSLDVNPNVPWWGTSYEPPIVTAVGVEDVKTVKRLISIGATPNTSNEWGYTPLFLAVSRRNYELVKLLLDAGANINLTAAENPESPLDLAIRRNDTRIINLLDDYFPSLNIFSLRCVWKHRIDISSIPPTLL